ncbi:MAG: Verru_Chthon cassette protein C [Candidatus Methylacidiphilales bacterium]|nr:Verru_Chthon cassette protein C [Candidatus Methylacidiphilales bacterium]
MQALSTPPAGRAGKRMRYAPRDAFTLIEMMAAVVVLSGIMLVIFGITNQISHIWRNSKAKIESFRGARAAFTSITSQLEQATLNTYYDYYQNGVRRTEANKATFIPTSYNRNSDLHFICGKSLITNQVGHSIFFQATLGRTDVTAYQGMDTMLNACGYYITYGPDISRPAFLDTLPAASPQRNRFRLMQFLQPSQDLSVYSTTAPSDVKNWFSIPVNAGRNCQPLAENIIAMVILPRLSLGDTTVPGSLAPQYEYDSRNSANNTTFHQMPPVIDIVMVAIDEPSAIRLGNSATAPDLGVSTLFQNASSLETDLRTLTTSLDARRITYRVFRTSVAIKGAKWSS